MIRELCAGHCVDPGRVVRLRDSARAALLLLLIVPVLCLQVPRAALAESESDREYRIKAAVLYNITSFVQWSPRSLPDRGENFHLCVIADRAIADLV